MGKNNINVLTNEAKVSLTEAMGKLTGYITVGVEDHTEKNVGKAQASAGNLKKAIKGALKE